MAINIPILTEFDSKGLQSAQGAFNNFKAKVGEADGAMGKFKAGGTAALDAVKANLGTFAAAGGAALAVFAAKAVTAFNDTALAAGKFADATGLSVEEASRWTEVAGDLGVEAGSVQKAMDKLNKAVATGAPEFKELGAQIQYTSAGAVDVNKTFLNTIDALRRIEDPTKRAELAAKTLGKGWQDMAELINQGSATLEDSLAGVADAKVIDEKELAKAREFRAQLDNLTDKGEEFAMTVGAAIVPVLADLLSVFTDIINVVGRAAQEVQNFMSAIGGRGLENMIDMVEAQEDLNTNLKDSWSAYYSSRRAAENLTRALEENKATTVEVDEQWQKLLGTLSDQEAWNNLLDALDDVRESSYESLVEGTAESSRRAQSAVGDLTREIYDYIQELGNIPPEVQSKIVALLDRGAFDEALAIVNNLRQGATVPISPQPGAYNPPVPGGQTGGPGRIPNPLRPIGPRLMATSSSTPNVIVNVAGTVTSERDLVETVRKGLVNAQRNGNGLVYSNV